MARGKIMYNASPADTARYLTITKELKDSFLITENNAFVQAKLLWEMKQKGLYRVNGYSGVGDYAEREIGIGKSQASQYVNAFDRFRNKHNDGIDEKYAGFSMTALIAMKALSDDEITAYKLINTMTMSELKKAIATAKTEDSASEDSASVDSASENSASADINKDSASKDSASKTSASKDADNKRIEYLTAVYNDANSMTLEDFINKYNV